MAGFGGSVKLTGESEYRNALKMCTQSLREMASAQQASAAQFNVSDKSTSALTTRQEQLNAILAKQKSALADVTASYNSFAAKAQEQADKHKALQDQYNKEVAELERIKAESGETSAAYKNQSDKVTELAAELKKSETAYNENEIALSKMRTQMNNAEATVNKTAKELDELGNEAQEAGEKAKKGGDGFTVMKGILADLGSSAIKSALNGLKSLGGAFVNVGKQAVANYADYEQLTGGIETLFAESADRIKEYEKIYGKSWEELKNSPEGFTTVADNVISAAEDAYKTAGMSANEYMETVTSFSASLIQGLKGDTEAAADIADMAIVDMADNANKMGTSMDLIQNAYAGFAKSNFTMLDNLKLGYSGSAAEMARLINDSGVMGKEFKATAKNVKDIPFDKMIEAIHKVQENMGITGTTAKEASSTISGSVASMRAAWSNMLTGIADDNSNFEVLVKNLSDSVLTVMKNLIPRIQQSITGIANLVSSLVKDVLPQIVAQIPPILQDTLPILIEAIQTLLTSLLDILPVVLPILTEAFMQIVTALTGMLPQIISVGMQLIVQLIQGITQAIPQLVAMLPTIIKSTVDTLIQNLPAIIKAGIDLLIALINGIVQAIPQLINMLPQIIDTIVTVLMDNLPLIIDAGIQLMVALINGIIKSLPSLIAAVPKLIAGFVSTFIKNLPQILTLGVKVIASIVQGIGQTLGTLISKAGDVIRSVINKFKELPQKIVDVGKNLVKGLWNGINDAKNWVIDKIKGFGDAILNGIKSFFGIKSPSRLFRDQIGKNLALGVGEGFTDEMADVTKEMQSALPTSLDTSINTGVNGATSAASGSGYDNMVAAFKEALAGVKIVLDDEEVGTFIDRTVTDLVYN